MSEIWANVCHKVHVIEVVLFFIPPLYVGILTDIVMM